LTKRQAIRRVEKPGSTEDRYTRKSILCLAALPGADQVGYFDAPEETQ
jgi:hypothetical protein